MWIADDWIDYELIDTGNGEKLERWGKNILRRPDPQAMWPILDESKWSKVDACYHRSESGGGHWEKLRKMQNEWIISYKQLKFIIKTMGFKHTGLFPEQATNWDWLIDKVNSMDRQLKILNLFGYTGGATVACAFAGAQVCHVDASKGMVAQAKENMALSGLADKPVRYIVDDVVKFVQREKRRGNKYDGIIMDPPVYGRGPNGEIWSVEKDLYNLVELCTEILSDEPVFMLVNCYTSVITPLALNNILSISVSRKFGGEVLSKEIGLRSTLNKLVLPCGISGRWEYKK